MFAVRALTLICFLLILGFQDYVETKLVCEHGKLSNGKHCFCEDGYQGHRCDSLVCGSDGYYYNGGDCICKNNFIGDYCNKKFEGCEENADCYNGGVCVENKCKCKNNYLNSDCSFECSCKNDGLCSIYSDEQSEIMARPVCDCKGTHFRGNSCSDNFCYGAFKNARNGSCICSDGFSGQYCEIKVEECDSTKYCPHETLKCKATTTHMLLNDKWNSNENSTVYDCFCPEGANCCDDGYTGKDCDIPEITCEECGVNSSCIEKPSKTNAINQDDVTTCKCTDYFGGVTCKLLINCHTESCPSENCQSCKQNSTACNLLDPWHERSKEDLYMCNEVYYKNETKSCETNNCTNSKHDCMVDIAYKYRQNKWIVIDTVSKCSCAENVTCEEDETPVIQTNNDTNFTLIANCTYQNSSFECLCNNQSDGAVCKLLSFTSGVLSTCKNCNESLVTCFESDTSNGSVPATFICDKTLKEDENELDITPNEPPTQANSKLLTITSIVCGCLLLCVVMFIGARYYRGLNNSHDLNDHGKDNLGFRGVVAVSQQQIDTTSL